MLNDTIAAIATPMGEGGIGIVRISGERALDILDKVFRPGKPRDWKVCPTHTLYYGHVIDQVTGETVDEVLVSVMRAPRTYTTEDVVEINCHGGIVAMKRALQVVLTAGARLAEPGEFTQRALLNGRIDLSQAEAVIDLIRAKTDKALQVAVNQLSGGLSKAVRTVRAELMGILALIEAGIDFPEEGIDQISVHQIGERVAKVREKVGELVRSGEIGKVFREGISVVLAGKTNVGKSSLMNALLKENRAIVTDIPGTTRDVIEETINLKGIPVRIIDTAGIRETSDMLERLGVEKTKECLGQADLVLLVLDAAAGISREDLEILDMVGKQQVIIIVNKIDVGKLLITRSQVMMMAGERPWLEISAEQTLGLEALADLVSEMVLGGIITSPECCLVTRLRHQEALRKTISSLETVEQGAELGVSQDLLSIDLRAALDALGEITGETVGEDVLDRIFADFCVGK